MTLSRITDLALVRETVTHPSIWRHVSYDGLDANAWDPPADAVYVGAWADEFLGLWMVAHQTPLCCEIHTCLLPCARGVASEGAAKMAAWIRDNTQYKRVVTSVPAYNVLALSYARRAGMVEYGRNPAVWPRDGKAYDMILLGMCL